MNLVDLVAVLVLIQLIFFSAVVGRARTKYGVNAPAIVGNEMFERAYRVQMNTLEVMVVLLPSMYLAARYWSAHYAAACGAVYLVGRLVYWRSYMKDPKGRSVGFALSIGPVLVLLVATIVGLIRGFG
jgi:uncharacterized membrane protein YecN with MAPEG domain